jgi:signal transduction histidine kinase
MLKQILSFARGVSGEHVVIQPKHLIHELAGLIRDTFPQLIRVQCQVPDDLQSISGDVTKLYQVLLNLCVNARDAMPNGGTLLIRADNIALENEPIRGAKSPISGPFVRLAVSDTGTGIPPELLDKIFETFFTTKAPGKGTGLGLATVRNIAKDHGGFVEVSSEVGKGTCFSVYLPAWPQVAQEPTQAPPAELPEGHGELIRRHAVTGCSPSIMALTP